LNLTAVNSHLDGWKIITLTLNTSQTQHHKRWKTCTITHDYRAKQIYPSMIERFSEYTFGIFFY
jgi:hypothetical protein